MCINSILRIPPAIELISGDVFYQCAEFYIQVQTEIDQKLCVKFMAMFLDRADQMGEESARLILVASHLCKKMFDAPASSVLFDFDLVIMLVQRDTWLLKHFLKNDISDLIATFLLRIKDPDNEVQLLKGLQITNFLTDLAVRLGTVTTKYRYPGKRELFVVNYYF